MGNTALVLDLTALVISCGLQARAKKVYIGHQAGDLCIDVLFYIYEIIQMIIDLGSGMNGLRGLIKVTKFQTLSNFDLNTLFTCG